VKYLLGNLEKLKNENKEIVLYNQIRNRMYFLDIFFNTQDSRVLAGNL